MKINKQKRTWTLTLADNVKRSFKPFSIGDMRKIYPHLLVINNEIPGLNFIDTDNYDSIIKVLVLMFSPKYCDKPLSLEEIESGTHITVTDLIPIIDVMYQLSGIDSKKLNAQVAEFEKNILPVLTKLEETAVKENE